MNTDTIARLVEGRVHDPDGNGQELLSVPTKKVVIADNLVDQEGALVQELNLEPPYAVVSDPLTHEVLGNRVERALESIGPVYEVHLGDHPHADMRTANSVIAETSRAGTLIAVGSGTINDLCKYAASKQNKRCAVFATAPSMNGYTSVNAAISEHGLKKSLPAVAPQGVFMDLEVLAGAPVRMIRSGLGDSVCRATAQSDWLLAHLVLGGTYRQAPFTLLAEDEQALLAEPEALVTGDLEAMARLARTLVLSGFGMTVCGGSFPASQGEHLISHYIEMMPVPGVKQTFHGEQIAVTTCVMARLQEQMLKGPRPRVEPSTPTRSSIIKHFGPATGVACWNEYERKRLTVDKTDQMNAHLERTWPDIYEQISSITISPTNVESILKRAGAPTSFADIGLSRDYFVDAVTHAREIRNRYTFLDLAADAGRLDTTNLV